MSMRPQPYALLGTVVTGLPQLVASVRRTAVFEDAFNRVWRTFNAGVADMRSAAAPATCGPAIDVPLSLRSRHRGRWSLLTTPGAAISGDSAACHQRQQGPRT